MKSIPEIAGELDISSTTIREYLKQFTEFFADPVTHEGLKTYPDDTADLVKKIHEYYQSSGMTKEQIRVKLGGTPDSASGLPVEAAAPAAPAAAGAMDSEQFGILTDKLDHLIRVIENLTTAITGAGQQTFKRVSREVTGKRKIEEINAQLTDIIELSRGGDPDNLEQNVLDADGTIIFSYGKLSPNARDSMMFAKTHKKPWLHIDLETERNPSPLLREWLSKFEIGVLNVAGRSATKVPGLQRSVNDIVSLLLDK